MHVVLVGGDEPVCFSPCCEKPPRTSRKVRAFFKKYKLPPSAAPFSALDGLTDV